MRQDNKTYFINKHGNGFYLSFILIIRVKQGLDYFFSGSCTFKSIFLTVLIQ